MSRDPRAKEEPARGGEGIRICGLAAVRARFRADPGSIQRLFFDLPTSRKVGLLCGALAASRRPYRVVEPAELERIGGTIHHGGIVAVVSAPKLAAATAADIPAWVRWVEPLVVLERIGNPHNLGAIARTAAFFGVPRLIIAGGPDTARPGDAAYRVAEGGMECLDVRTTSDLPAFLRALGAAGYAVVGAATRGGSATLRDPDTARKTSGGAPGAASPSRGLWALVLGNEEEGLSAEAAAACTRRVTIPGSGQVESLNVSAAAAVLMHGLVRTGR